MEGPPSNSHPNYLLVHSSDVYPKGRDKCKYHCSIGVGQPGAADADATLRNAQWPNVGLKASSTSTPESSLCLRATKELERVGGKEKS